LSLAVDDKRKFWADQMQFLDVEFAVEQGAHLDPDSHLVHLRDLAFEKAGRVGEPDILQRNREIRPEDEFRRLADRQCTAGLGLDRLLELAGDEIMRDDEGK